MNTWGDTPVRRSPDRTPAIPARTKAAPSPCSENQHAVLPLIPAPAETALPPCSDDQYGILPPADQPYRATLPQIRQRFVHEAPANQDRRELIADMLDLHVKMIRKRFDGIDIRIWLDGGFTTHKLWRTQDADLVVLVPGSAIIRADSDRALPLWTLSDVKAHRGGADGPRVVTPKLHTGLGLTDAYVVRSDRPAHVEIWRRRWSRVTDENGNGIEGIEKGFVEVIEGE